MADWDNTLLGGGRIEHSPIPGSYFQLDHQSSGYNPHSNSAAKRSWDKQEVSSYYSATSTYLMCKTTH